jgi:hypothetical protein
MYLSMPPVLLQPICHFQAILRRDRKNKRLTLSLPRFQPRRDPGVLQ